MTIKDLKKLLLERDRLVDYINHVVPKPSESEGDTEHPSPPTIRVAVQSTGSWSTTETFPICGETADAIRDAAVTSWKTRVSEIDRALENIQGVFA